MRTIEDELRTVAVPLCGSFLGAFTFPLTVFALQYCFRHEPLWLPVATNSQWPAFVLNEYYWPMNLALSVGPLTGCLASVLFLPNREFKKIGILRYGLVCLAGYYAMSFLGCFLQMKDGFHPYVLCAASWAMTIGICVWAKKLAGHTES